MKKGMAFLSVILLLLALYAYGRNGSGNVSNVVVVPVQSDIYTDEDIDAAIKTVIKYFKREFSGCTLKEIQYIGDGAEESFNERAEHYKADEAIILVSTFDVDSSGGDGSLNPNSTYDNWEWILIRNANGKWRHIDHGYG